MPVFGITGGIATGKSTFIRGLLHQRPANFFDADACARDLLENDLAIRDQIHQAFGLSDSAADRPGERARLRELIFTDTAKRKRLEAIMHPAIRTRWMAAAQLGSAAGEWFFVDIPLLYETEAQSQFDRVIVVACSPANQRARLREIRALGSEMTEKVIAAQLDQRIKITKADYIIWNDSTISSLEGQTALLVEGLSKRYG